MLRSLSRNALSLLACVSVVTACGSAPQGECRGAYGSRNVVWPLGTNSLRLGERLGETDGPSGTELFLGYAPDDATGLSSFGVDIWMPRLRPITEGVWTAKLLRQGNALVAEDTSKVDDWRPYASGLVGYPSVTGIPTEATLTLEQRSYADGQAQGRFVYHYEDGGELTCTFNIIQDPSQSE